MAVVWSIWEARNQAIFKEKEIEQVQVVDMIKFRVSWWFKHHDKGSTEPITSILLNIPDVCKESCKLEDALERQVGGVLRNSGGKVLCIFLCHVGIQRSNTAEIMAIGKACSLCASRMELSGKEIVILSDSKVAVSWIFTEGIGNLDNCEAIYDIRDCLRSMPTISVVFSSRATNSFCGQLGEKGVQCRYEH
ncbi:hypothetical protein Dsin_022976 [Dipteronia sinensis]|uniref:RNase H type-1 domain-containing protein n=1 Tax=Dipteronia sinensis TaxID=43782 RepID=A0AAE0A3W5_9ROSI|nr:hypothetical protein Dsin_022976 [Dipteronia sinensis]